MSLQTIEQRRAKHAWTAIQALKKNTDAERDEYTGEAKKLPARIMAAGLGPALAFLAAKAKDKKKHLNQFLADLSSWVLKERSIACTHPTSLLESVVFGDATFLRRATDESLSYLQWLNRFADAEFGTDKKTGGKT